MVIKDYLELIELVVAQLELRLSSRLLERITL